MLIIVTVGIPTLITKQFNCRKITQNYHIDLHGIAILEVRSNLYL